MFKSTVILLLFTSFVSVSYGDDCAYTGNKPTRSSCTNSEVEDTTLTDSSVSDSTVNLSTLTGSQVTKGSCVQRSTITDSIAINATIFEATVTGSTIKNRKICKCTVTDNNFDACLPSNCPDDIGCPTRPTADPSDPDTTDPSDPTTTDPSVIPRPCGHSNNKPCHACDNRNGKPDRNCGCIEKPIRTANPSDRNIISILQTMLRQISTGARTKYTIDNEDHDCQCGDSAEKCRTGPNDKKDKCKD
jgi:hypothetical protein